jgi:Chaperone of endosialidase
MENTEIQPQQKRKIENMRTPHSRKSINPSPLRLAFLLIPFVFVCFGLSPVVRAVVPAPDGGYPGANTAEGDFALFSLTTGTSNTAIGFGALGSNTTGDFNTAEGRSALIRNTSGSQNTATGVNALISNTIGSQNTATGVNTLISNTTGFQNAATGAQALFANTTGFHNTSDGFAALSRTTTGQHNTATGDEALGSNTTGNFNTADGAHSLENSTGTGNTALGFEAGANVTTASNVICLGAGVLGANENNSCFIGNVFNRTSPGGTAVFVDSNGKLGTITSSRRFKEEIEPMAQASEGLFALKPVTFRYKKGIDPQRIPQFGLVAEDVEAVNPDLVVRDEEGKVNTVRYDAVNAMLLNEFLKEHRKVEELSSIVAEQRKEVNALAAAVKEQAAQVQKVSAQVELGKVEPKMVVNKQ